MHHRLINNEVQDKMLNGELSVEECDEKYVHEFLSILKKREDRNNELSLGGTTIKINLICVHGAQALT